MRSAVLGRAHPSPGNRFGLWLGKCSGLDRAILVQMRTSVSSPLAIGLLVVILVTAVILGIMNRTRAPQSTPATPSTVQIPSDVNALIAKVALHILVQKDERPSVATVQDPEVLKKQNPLFYKDVQVGDRLLIWSDKAVLYSPSRDILLSVVSLNLQQNVVAESRASSTSTSPVVAASSSSTTPEEAATIEVRNGSGRAGRAKSFTQKLIAAGLNVIPPRDAYEEIVSTIIVKRTSAKFPRTLQILQSLTSARIAPLPDSEAALQSDFLVILGADSQP